jgi:hypothetical protein
MKKRHARENGRPTPRDLAGGGKNDGAGGGGEKICHLGFSISSIRGVHRLPSHGPLPAPVAFLRPCTVFTPFSTWAMKDFFLIPLQMQTAFNPSIMSFWFIRKLYPLFSPPRDRG